MIMCLVFELTVIFDYYCIIINIITKEDAATWTILIKSYSFAEDYRQVKGDHSLRGFHHLY